MVRRGGQRGAEIRPVRAPPTAKRARNGDMNLPVLAAVVIAATAPLKATR
jgi:hypothetical protein